MIDNRARRFGRPLALACVALIASLGCGATPPVLPRLAPRGPLPPGDAEAGERLMRDRSLGRSGFACADCHPVDAPRPGPSLDGASPGGVDWCVERFLRRPPLPTSVVADLLAVAPAITPPLPATGEAIYAQQCGHCHGGGPAGPVLDQAWPRARLTALIRGTDRPRHPDTLMPAFAPDVLDEMALKLVVDYVVSMSGARGRPGMSAREMMVGSHR